MRSTANLIRFQMALTIILLGMCRLAVANERYDAWQARHPFTQTAWTTHRNQGGEKVDLDYFLGSGLNTFFDGVRSGSSAWKHPYSQGLPTLLMASVGNKKVWPDMPTFLADFRKAQNAHENIVGVILGDEVSEPGPSSHMQAIRDWIVNNKDPKISSMITISSVPPMDNDWGALPEGNHWDKLLTAIQPDVWLIQHYPALRGEDDVFARFYSQLELFFNWTRENDVALWIYPRLYSAIIPEPELRLQRFSSLAYGVRGFADFMWPCTSPPSAPDAGYWDGSGKPTVTYKRIAPINREIANVAKGLIRLTPVSAYHMDSRDADGRVRHWMDSDAELPTWIRRTWKLANVTGALNRNHLLVGFFRDAAGQEYFMVVNKDCAKDQTSDELATNVTLSFHPSVKAIQRLKRSDGQVETISVKDNYIFTLPGGTGDLFKFDTGAPFAGIEPVTIPSLSHGGPDGGGLTLPRFANNRIVLQFDRASAACAEIRMLDKNGKETGPDLADRFIRTVSKDNRTVIYEEDGAVLANKTDYRVILHWAKGKPFTVRTLRGDVDGDGKLSEQDLAALGRATECGSGESACRADLDANGRVDGDDLQIITRLLTAPKKFCWADSFNYPPGPLTGRGSWLDVESLPSSVTGKSVIRGSAEVTNAGSDLHGPNKLAGGVYPDYRGNETIFHREGGFGEVGVLRFGFLARLGTTNIERVSFHIANSNDTEGVMGAIHCQVVLDEANVFTSRGVKLLDATDGGAGADNVFKKVGALQGPDGKGMALEYLVDFDAGTITWKCLNMNTGKQFGPRTVHYSGRFEALDCINFWIAGQGAQLDDFWVQNY